jgi:hypothetical protein
MTAQPAVTPGFQARVRIFFQAQGETQAAYRMATHVKVAVRVPLADAQRWAANDEADVIPGFPEN